MSDRDPAAAVLDLTRELVAIDSVSSSLVEDAPGEAHIAAFVRDRLAAAGFGVRMLPAASDPRRVSVIATWSGSRPGRTVVLNGHLDTVGVEGMPQPFEARIEDERLYGRGTSDMKGGVAGLIVAGELLVARDVPGTIIVALVADEEDASLGAEAVIADLIGSGTAMDLCLIAEPTWLDLAVAHRGYAVVKATFTGVAAHSSQPAEGVDAVLPLGRLLTAVSREDARLRDALPHPLLDHGSLMATVVRAGSAPFTVAASAEAFIERRTLPGDPATVAIDEVSALVAEASGGVATSAELVIFRDAWQQHPTGAAAEFADLLASALAESGTTPERVGAPYWMESPLWQSAGVPTVVCGPAGGGLHAVDEWVDVRQLERFPVAVANAVGRFLEGS